MKAMPALMASSGFLQFRMEPFNCYGTAIVFIYTKDSAHDFCTASAHEACYAEDFAFAQGEGDFRC